MAITGAEFTLTDNQCENQSLAADVSCSFKLNYTPNEAVTFAEGELLITTDHAEHSAIEVELFGTDEESLEDDGWYGSDAWKPNGQGGFDVNCDLLDEEGSAELGLMVTGPGRISFNTSVGEGNRLAYRVDGKSVRQFRKKPGGGSEQHNTELGEGSHHIDFEFDGMECSGDGIGDINIDIDEIAGNDAEFDEEDDEEETVFTVAGAFNPLTLFASLLLLPLLRARRQ